MTSRLLKRLGLTLGLILACAGLAHGQGVRKDDFVINQAGKPIPNAAVTICPTTSTGTPCTPTATVYFDSGLTIPLTQPLVTGPIGNFGFYTAPGEYIATVTGATIQPVTLHYSIPCTPSASAPGCGGGGGGSGTINTGVNGNISVYSAATTLSDSLVPVSSLVSTAVDNTFTSNQRFKGQDPWSDVTAFGARSFGSGGNAPAGNWASCNANTTVGLTTNNGGFTFKNNDGIEIDGCGPTNTLSTPSAPTVTPATAASPTGTEWFANIPGAGVGASNYSYAVIARDRFGGLTAVSATTSITTGQATLGLITNNIATITRANDVLTVVTTGNNLVNAGSPSNAATEVHIVAGTGRDAMNGYYLVCSRTNATTFTLCTTPVDTRAQGWNSGDTNQQLSGTISYFVSNHIHITAVANAWEYYICGQRPGDGALKLIGSTKTQGAVNGYVDLDFDDYGSPFMDNQTFPRYVTNASCVSAVPTNDMYSGTVVSGGGTTTLTVTPATSQTVAGPAFTGVDAAPGFLAAMKSSNFNTNGALGFGHTLIPGGPGPGPNAGYAYKLIYPLIIPAGTGIDDNSDVVALETTTMMGNVTLQGIMNPNLGTPQFGFNAYSTWQSLTGEPVISAQAVGNLLDHMDILNNTSNGGVAVITDNGFGFGANYVNFHSNAVSTDYLSMGLIVRDTSQTISFVNLYTTYFNGGPNQVTDASWTPLLWMPPGQNGGGSLGGNVIKISSLRSSWSRRGFVFTANGGSNGPDHLDFSDIYAQGSIAPRFVFQNMSANSQLSIHNTSQDTEGNPLVACLNITGACGSFDLSMIDLSSNNPVFSGARPNSVHMYEVGTAGAAFNFALPNRNGCHEGSSTGVFAPYDTSGTFIPSTSDLFTCFSSMHMPSGQSFFYDITQPNTVAGTPAAGGSVPVGSYYYCVSPVGFDSGEGICSLPSAVITTTGGNQTVNGTYVGSVGAVTYNIYRCVVASSCLNDGGINSGWSRVILHQAGTSFSDTFASGNGLGPPFVSGTGVTLANNLEVVGPQFACPETVAPAGVVGFDIFYCDSTSHKLIEIPNNGAPIILGSGGNVTSVTIAGTANQITATGTCTITTTGTCTLSIPNNPTLPGTTSGTFSGNLTGNASGTAASITGNLTGDTTSVGMATTTVKINGTSVPTTVTSHQVLVTTGAAVGTWKTVIDCQDSAGNHINYTQSTDTFSCGTSSSGGGGGAFSSITSATNTTAAMVVGTGASLTVSGSGTINATTLLGNTWAIPGTIGSTTPNTGAFTTLSATSTVSGAGFTAFMASPPAIGGSAPAAGAFTTLSATSTVSGAGITALFASPPSIGNSAPGTGAFTTLSATSTVSGAGFNAFMASPPAIGGTSAAAGSFTTLKANTFVVTEDIASGTSALGTTLIASGNCASVVTASATSAATTDNLSADFSTDPSAVTGYGVNVNGILTVYKWITTNNVNFKVCNSTANSITPGSITLQWRVIR